MELSAIALFVEVVRRGSFAAAARASDVDPSAVSRVIAGLESELGVRLFQRSTRRLSPTEAGVRYFEQVEPILEELDKARLLAMESGRAPQGTLRIACPVSYGLLNLVPLLGEFSKQYPELKFDLVMTDQAIDLVTERLDVAIRLGPLADSSLIAVQLETMVGKVCASPAYLERFGRPKRPSDLTGHPCLLLQMPGFGEKWRFRSSAGRMDEVEVTGPLRSSNALALMQCAVAGMGVILQGDWIVGAAIADGSLVDLFPRHEVTAAEFEHPAMWIVYPSRTYVPEKVRVFVAFLKERVGQGKSLYRPR